MMVQEVGVALAILKQALDVEQEGREFYLKAAKATADEKGQETFRILAADEQSHFRLLEKQHQSLLNSRRWVRSAEVKPVKIDLNLSLFPKGKQIKQTVVAAGADERDALLFGLGIESKSYDFYRKAASEIADPLGKSTFEFLAGEERRHYDILMMRYDFLFGPIAWTS